MFKNAMPFIAQSHCVVIMVQPCDRQIAKGRQAYLGCVCSLGGILWVQVMFIILQGYCNCPAAAGRLSGVLSKHLLQSLN